MGKVFEQIDDRLSEWLTAQHMFFVASAPLAASGHVNCSPKGGDAFRILGPRSVAYQDIVGSGAETIAHLRENGRIVLMFCSFTDGPKIVRLHGRGETVSAGHPEYAQLARRFPPHIGTRAFIRIELERISDSCGFGVPLYDYRGERETLDKWAANKGEEGLEQYKKDNNRVSIDGLAALD